MYLNDLPDHMSPAVQARYKLERIIVQSLVNELIDDHDCLLILDDGEGSVGVATDDGPFLLSYMMETDVDRIEAYPHGGSVLLVYGNGCDVIADYSMNLEPMIAKTLALAAAFERAVEAHSKAG
ncbi:hypothetical protein RD149_21725 [Gordonia westfalica]|uniref:Immunity protein Imm1 n=1 Tax=Gordonia westfalica TaxID=158898 RepID=A0ABU2GZ45_9ACTN|nr:hypothetical protein [Gordonia westfalica]MDS1116367.1 hypothetical protein [Gordonia westfalica]